VSSTVRQACKSLEERHGDAFRKEPERFSEELIEEASRLAGLPKSLLYYAVEWLKNMAWYEGARWFQPENNVSGKQCPRCGAWGWS